MFYNESFLAPFFLSHYHYVDSIHVLLDTDTNDNTKEILAMDKRVVIENITFPDMMDDIIKANHINRVLKTIDSDWIYVLDADEFIFPPGFVDPREYLSTVNGNVVIARMWQVYRHFGDKDLDINDKPVVLQRRHGDTNRERGINAAYNKPIILHPPIAYDLLYGNHLVLGDNFKTAGQTFDGAHWAMADVEFAIDRRIKGRKCRQSKNNLKSGLTYHQHSITAQGLIDECNDHMNDERLF